MGVFVPVVYRIHNTVPYERVRVSRYGTTTNGGINNVAERGTKATATSQIIKTKDYTWSPCHPYTRTAWRMSHLNGHLERFAIRQYPEGTRRLSARITGGIAADTATGFQTVLLTMFTSPYADQTGKPYAMPTNLRNRLITELLLKAGRRQISLGEALLESKETLRLLSFTVIRLIRAMKYFDYGDFRAFCKVLGLPYKKRPLTQSLSEYWLEYSYGWMPLINDIYDGYMAFQKGLNRPQLVRAVRQISNYRTFDYSSRNGDGTVTHGQMMSGTSVESARAVAYFRLNSQWASNLQQLGLINPVEIAWAVMPFSFVLDWLVPVQNVLEAVTATVGLTFVDGSTSHRVESHALLGWRNHSSMDFAAASDYTPDWSYMYRFDHFGQVREVLTNITPGFYVKNPLSSTHVVSALALLRTLRR